MPAQRLTYDHAMGLSDAELEERLYSRISDVEEDDIYGDLCLFVDELTERHAPHIARMSLEHIYADDRERLEENLEALREREGARLIRRALPILPARESGYVAEAQPSRLPKRTPASNR